MRRWLPLSILYSGLIALGWLMSDQVSTAVALAEQDGDISPVTWMIGLICVVYLLASAIPFVPGAEIGLGLIAVFGARIALLVYLCMVCALSLSYVVGRWMPTRWLIRSLEYLRLHKTAALVRDLPDQPSQAFELRLFSGTQNRLVLALLRYRYVALAVAINVPGNSVLGGGGGLALFAGLSRLFNPLGFIVTILIAVAPIPLTVFMMGYEP